LYRNRELVSRALPEEEAVDRLVELIKESGDWVDAE
jgi:(E)-4-hydroxy-3-methylbut-2-enyl-diphosphate synthase